MEAGFSRNGLEFDEALTLRVDNELYDRLRRFAFDRELTHQEVLEAALRGHLDVHGG